MEQLYEIAYVESSPPPLASLADAPWEAAATAPIEWYHPAGSDHRPRVEFRALWDRSGLIVRYTAVDRHLRCIHTTYQDPVYEDSCCELFLQPEGTDGYFNIETNAIGTLMISYITDPRRTADGFAGQAILPERADREITRHTTLSGPIDPEIESERRYQIEVRIPFSVLEEYSGVSTPKAGTRWRGNVYKCSENSSHPHWGAWSPIGDRLDFHQPDRFGAFVFS